MHNKQMEAGLSHLEYSYTKMKIMNTLPSPSEVREI